MDLAERNAEAAAKPGCISVPGCKYHTDDNKDHGAPWVAWTTEQKLDDAARCMGTGAYAGTVTYLWGKLVKSPASHSKFTIHWQLREIFYEQAWGVN